MSSKPLALITAFGGINSAGRSSAHLSYKNLVSNSISEKEQLDKATTNSQAKSRPKTTVT